MVPPPVRVAVVDAEERPHLLEAVLQMEPGLAPRRLRRAVRLVAHHGHVHGPVRGQPRPDLLEGHGQAVKVGERLVGRCVPILPHGAAPDVKARHSARCSAEVNFAAPER